MGSDYASVVLSIVYRSLSYVVIESFIVKPFDCVIVLLHLSIQIIAVELDLEVITLLRCL